MVIRKASSKKITEEEKVTDLKDCVSSVTGYIDLICELKYFKKTTL